MLKRIITGTGIFAVLIGMFASRIFWTTEITVLEGGVLTAGVVLFDAVLALMAIVGTFEVVRAMDVKMLFIEKIIALIFPIIVFPIATFCGATYAFVVIAIYGMLTVALSVFAFNSRKRRAYDAVRILSDGAYIAARRGKSYEFRSVIARFRRFAALRHYGVFRGECASR